MKRLMIFIKRKDVAAMDVKSSVSEIYDAIRLATPQEWRIGQSWMNFISWHVNKYGNDIFYINNKELLSRYTEFMLEITIPRG